MTDEIKVLKDRVHDLEQIIELKEKIHQLEKKLSDLTYPRYYPYYPVYPYVYPIYIGGQSNIGTGGTIGGQSFTYCQSTGAMGSGTTLAITN